MPIRHALLAVLVSVLWGLNFLAIHASLQQFPPLFLVGLRFALLAVPAILLVPRPLVPLRWLVAYGVGFVASAAIAFLLGIINLSMPANEIVGLAPGELFVHRNVANIVDIDDPNCMSVVQYAVEVLRVRHIIVTGHYGCGGVRAALDGTATGFVGEWLAPLVALMIWIGVYPKPFLERMEVTVVELLQDVDQRRLVNPPPLGELIGSRSFDGLSDR